jgi:hypothetical protein
MTIITKGMGVVLKGMKSLKKGSLERKAKAVALREHRSSKSHKAYKKLIKSIPHDLTYLKGQK